MSMTCNLLRVDGFVLKKVVWEKKKITMTVFDEHYA